MPVEKQLGVDSNNKKRPWTNQKKTQLEPSLRSNSDEELELELTKALKVYWGSRKKKIQSDQNKLGVAQPCTDFKSTKEGIATQTQTERMNSVEKTSAQISRKSDELALEKSLLSWLRGPAQPAEQKEKENDLCNDATESNLPGDKNPSLDIDEMFNFFLFPQKTCKQAKKKKLKDSMSLIDYEKQGAIPKSKFKSKEDVEKSKENQRKKENSKTVNTVPKCRANSKSANGLERKKNNRRDHSSGKDSEGDDHKSVNAVNEVLFQPFFYVVPENPSPDFFFPRGCYYVVPKEVDSSTNIVFHPEKNSSLNVHNIILKENLELSGDENDLAQAAHENINDPDRNVPFGSHIGLNITPVTEIERRLTEDDLGESEAHELLAMKAVLAEKLQKEVLQSNELSEKLYLIEVCLNMKNSFSFVKGFYDKEKSDTLSIFKDFKEEDFKNRFSKLLALFPGTDKNYLRKKLEECCGRQDLFEDLIEVECRRSEEGAELDEGFKLLLQELPDYDFGLLYRLWNESAGDKDVILEFIEQKVKDEKLETLKQSLILEFPDIEEAAANDIVGDYLDNDEGLVDFIASEHLKRKVKHQFAVMTAALPDSNAAELQKKCIEFQGDEDQVQEYIRKVRCENRIQSQVLNMLLILPDADPEFLKQEVKKLDADVGAVNNLTDQLLESQNYPKYCPDKEALERKRLWRIYVENFDVKEYLHKTPSPENFAGVSGNHNKANPALIMKFLQSRYPDLTEEQLQQHYTNNRSNITKTCLMLEETIEPIRLALSDFNNEAFNEAFLREICYIDFKREIENFLTDVETKRAIEAEEARLNNAFLTCPLCSNEELIPSEAAACPDGHVYCKNCISRYVNVKIGDGLYKFPCFSEDCETCFTYATLEDILPKSLLSEIVKKQQAEEISEANVDGLETCPYCEYSCIPNSEDSIFKCQNPECLTEICRKCGDKSHLPLRCEEIERPRDVEARKKIEEAMTETLVRVCPKCQRKFVKTDGCNKMTCFCGAIICYFCRKIVDGYNHFKDRNPNSNCSLYSTNEDLHQRQVLEEGIRVRNDILRENPEIHILHDPTLID